VQVDVWLVVAFALLLGSAAPLAPGAALATAVGLLFLLRRALPFGWALLAAALVAASGARATDCLTEFERHRTIARDELGEPRRCAGEGRLVASPVWKGDALRSIVEFEALDCEGERLTGPLRVRLYGGPAELSRGSQVFVVAQLGPLRMFRNAGLSDPTAFAARQRVVLTGSTLNLDVVQRGKGYRAWIDRARAFVRWRIQETFAPEAAPLARALVLGENDLSPEEDDAFRRSGLSHLLAVSGTHLVFAVVTLIAALRALLLRVHWLSARVHVSRVASVVGIALAPAYADFAGGSGSAWRAAWMLSLVFAARAAERKPNTARVFALTLIVGVLIDPLVCFDISFMLSLAATGGLVVLAPPLVRRCRQLRFAVLRYLGMSLAATVAAMVPCAPLLASISPELTLAGLVANVVAAPIGELAALPVCLTHAVTAAFPRLEQGLALVGSGALLAVRQIALTSAAQEYLAFRIAEPTRWHFAVLALGAAGILAARASTTGMRTRAGSWVVALLVSLGVVEASTRRAAAPSELRVHMLDVGQGDATLLEVPKGRAILVDGGGFVGSPVDPGQRVIVPWLRAHRHERLEIVALSHPHPDHFGGLLSVAEQVPIGEFWDTGQGQAEGAGPVYEALLTTLRARGVPILRPPRLCGKPRRLGEVTLEVLAPCPSYVPRRDANDNSLVIKVTHGARSFLLTGDAELHQEHELVARYGPKLEADVLKVGHHGSRTSTTPEFLAQVRPRFATISCGVRNRFGHPHAPTLHTLSAASVIPLRTDRMGSITFTSDGERLDLYASSYAY